MVRIVLALLALNGFSHLVVGRRWHEDIGISSIVFLAFTVTTIFPLLMAFFMLPPFVLIAKITPAHVEATVFSFAASVINVGFHFGRKYMCLTWNALFFHVTTENMETEFWKLNVLEICLALLSFIYVPLIPTWDEVRE